MENVIELSHVDAGYPGVVILKDVTFSVARGEVFILLGGSGCGKTTIMRHLIGLNPILGGRLTVSGLEWGPETRDRLFRKIGVMYQSGALFGLLVGLIGCLAGMRTKSSSDGVGLSTTSAVVWGIVAIVITDGILAVLTYVWGIGMSINI